MNVTSFNVSVQNNVFFYRHVGSKPYVAGERNEKRPVAKAVKFDAGTLSRGFFLKRWQLLEQGMR